MTYRTYRIRFLPARYWVIMFSDVHRQNHLGWSRGSDEALAWWWALWGQGQYVFQCLWTFKGCSHGLHHANGSQVSKHNGEKTKDVGSYDNGEKYPFIFQSSCVSPGYIQTNLTKGWSGGLTPEQGTISTMRCLFDDLPGNGLFFGSDGLRSPIHVSRNPGEPEYDGKPPVFEWVWIDLFTNTK